MRLSRPAMVGLLVLCAAVVLWLVARTVAGDGGTTAGAPPSSPSASASPTSASPTQGARQGDGQEPEETSYPEQTQGEDGPSGTDTRDWDGIDACRDDVLPPELEDVAEDVEAGGPFEFPGKDGSTFGNREGYLPDEGRGYYREYTVETPGLDHRGARRIVTGGGETPDLPEVWYYTEDHYESFCEFRP